MMFTAMNNVLFTPQVLKDMMQFQGLHNSLDVKVEEPVK
jgi:hypothetical protein